VFAAGQWQVLAQQLAATAELAAWMKIDMNRAAKCSSQVHMHMQV
jgi:hypothetical protein